MLVGGETNFSFRLTLTSLNSECIHKLTGPTSVSGSKIEPSVQLTGVMWCKDTPGQQDKRTNDNKGLTSRKELTALRKSVQMMGKLHLDLFCQDKYLLNHVDLKIKRRRSRDAFALVADAVNSLWQLSQKHIVLNVIHVTGGYRVHLHFYPSDGVFTAGLFQCFYVTHSNGGEQVGTNDGKTTFGFVL
jgi:hypothetical protein